MAYGTLAPSQFEERERQGHGTVWKIYCPNIMAVAFADRVALVDATLASVWFCRACELEHVGNTVHESELSR